MMYTISAKRQTKEEKRTKTEIPLLTWSKANEQSPSWIMNDQQYEL